MASACGGSDVPLQTTTTTGSTTTSVSPTTIASSTTAAPTTATSTTAAPTTTTAAPTTTAAELSPAELYAANCARCHGDELEGGIGPALGPGGHAHGHSDAELIAIVTDGKNDMPAFADKLTEQQISDLIAFIRGGEAAG
jgi:mono/diheme cytochrome c family protein